MQSGVRSTCMTRGIDGVVCPRVGRGGGACPVRRAAWCRWCLPAREPSGV